MIESDPVLSEFARYCINHPEQRFWQALRNWIGYDKIVAVTVRNDPPPEPNPLMVSGYSETQVDTFTWEGKRSNN